MNTDIRVAVNFLDHPKFIKLERRLGWPGIKSLMRLWCWAAQYRPDGVFENMSAEDIEIAAQWNDINDSLTFVTTVVELRLLDVNNDVYSIHGWLNYNGFAASAPDRSDKARFSRMAKTHPEIYSSMKKDGVISITSEEYHKLTSAQRNVQRSLTNRSTKSLSPSPSPLPSPINKKTLCAQKNSERAVEDFEDKKTELLSRYSEDQRGMIDECLIAIASTRKSGKIANSIELGILKKWATAEPEEVERGISIYLDRRYHMDGKKENYLWGIIRNNEFGGNGRPKPNTKEPEIARPKLLEDGEDIYA